MQTVTENEVIAAWLRMELEKDHKERFDIGDERMRARDLTFAQLLAQKPGSARVFLEYELSWCRTALSEEEFRTLRVIWDDNRTVLEVARGLFENQSSLAPERVEHIKQIANEPSEFPDGWILNRRRMLGSGPFIQDGNHRAVAAALGMLRGAEYREKTVYVGYPSVDCFGYTGRLRRRFHLGTGTV